MPSTLCRRCCCYTTIVLSFIVWVMGGGIMGTEKPRCWDPHAEILRRRRWWYNNNNNNKTKSIFAAIRTRVIYKPHYRMYILSRSLSLIHTHTHPRARAIDTPSVRGTQISDYSLVLQANEYICSYAVLYYE